MGNSPLILGLGDMVQCGANAGLFAQSIETRSDAPLVIEGFVSGDDVIVVARPMTGDAQDDAGEISIEIDPFNPANAMVLLDGVPLAVVAGGWPMLTAEDIILFE